MCFKFGHNITQAPLGEDFDRLMPKKKKRKDGQKGSLIYMQQQRNPFFAKSSLINPPAQTPLCTVVQQKITELEQTSLGEDVYADIFASCRSFTS